MPIVGRYGLHFKLPQSRRGRTDLLIVRPQGGRARRFAVGCKNPAPSLEHTAADDDRCDAEASHLNIFARDDGRSLEQKTFHRRAPAGGFSVDVWGMWPANALASGGRLGL